MTRLIAKSSVVFVSTGQGTQKFGSLDELPPALKKKFKETVEDATVARILIADKRGCEELKRRLQNRPKRTERGVTTTVEEQRLEERDHRHMASFRMWLTLLLPLVIAAALWFLIGTPE